MSRIASIQKLIAENNFDVYIVPRSDAYQNEQVMACDERLKWLMGFSGSAGFAVVTQKESALFVDGRYTQQAKYEVNDKNTKILDFSSASLNDFLNETLCNDSVLAVCGDMITHRGTLMSRAGIEECRQDVKLKIIDKCLIDIAWGDTRPNPSYSQGWLIDRSKFGSIEGRVDRVKKRLKSSSQQAVSILVSGADSVCWLLGVRGSDIDMLPVLLSRAILIIDPIDPKSEWKIIWYVEGNRVDSMQSLMQDVTDRVEVKKSESLAQDISLFENLQIDENITPETLVVSSLGRYNASTCSVRAAQSIKSREEIVGFKDCHILDGKVMIELLAWIDRDGMKSEGEVVNKIEALRRKHSEYICPSFFPIVGIGENGAVVHYRGDPNSDRLLKSGELLLIDCGGQYKDGTTDVTRTVVCGCPEVEMNEIKRVYTNVLSSHVTLLRQRFPLRTTGAQLDTIARSRLWNYNCDYAHGSGHGVGHILGVHESPPSLSQRSVRVEIEEGMVLSVEPGVYRVGEYGIRIENLVVVERDKEWLYFSSLTCVPYAKELIDVEFLDHDQIEWINNYHTWVYDEQYRDLDEEDRDWLASQTGKLESRF